jgi:hypothetical protein
MTLFTSEKHMTNKVTRLLIILACAGVLSLFTAAATPLPTCANDWSLASYISTYNPGGGCVIGDKIFSNFSYIGSGNNPVPSTDVTVGTLGPAGSGAASVSSEFASDIGLEFAAPWTVPPGTTTDGAIGFDVTIGSGPLEIEDAGLVQTSGVTGTGTASVVENGCSGAVFPCTQQWNVLTNANTFAADTIFTPTGTISVSKDISVASGSNGTATISLVQDVFSQTSVPEPRSLSLLLGFGLVAGLALKKKFQSVRS